VEIDRHVTDRLRGFKVLLHTFLALADRGARVTDRLRGFKVLLQRSRKSVSYGDQCYRPLTRIQGAASPQRATA